MQLLPYLWAVLAIAAANAAIYAGIAFINGHLYPVFLSQVYTATGYFSRTVIMLGTASVAANILIAMGYRLAGPTVAAVAVVGTLVPVLIAKAVILHDAEVGWLLSGAVLLMTVGAALAVIALRP